MTYEELGFIDKVGAFSSFISVKMAKEQNIIPPDFHEYFPDVCKKEDGGCGSDMIISNTLTQIMCCNPRCILKLSFSLHKVLTNFNCKNVGEQTCKSIMSIAYRHMEMKSHLEVFTMEDKYLTTDRGAAFLYFKDAVEFIKNSELSFPDMIWRLAIPEFDRGSTKIFEDINNSTDLVEKIREAGSVQDFLARRNVYDGMKVFYLGEFLKDIVYAEYKIFNKVKPPGKTKISICITGSLYLEGHRISKDEFVFLCNKIGELPNGYRLFEVERNNAIKSTNYVIADSESNSNKFITARVREQEENRKLIYTSKEFVDYLKGVVEWVAKEKSSLR